jgi:hypothetical protein
MQQAQTNYEDLQKEHARLKGVAGRQAKEIAAGKAAEPGDGEAPPEPRVTRRRPAEFTIDDEGMTTYRGVRMEVAEAEMRRDDDQERRSLKAWQDAEDQRREDAEAAQLARAEADATHKVRQEVAEVGVKTAMAVLKIEDEPTADVAGFMVDAMLRATAAERNTPLEALDGDALSAILKDDVLPAVEMILGFRHRAQAEDNQQHRAAHPGQTGGTPGVPGPKLPSEMTEAERMRAFEQVSQKYDGSAT